MHYSFDTVRRKRDDDAGGKWTAQRNPVRCDWRDIAVACCWRDAQLSQNWY